MKLPALAGIVGLAGLSLAASLPQANDLMGRDEMASLEAANVEAAMGGVAFVPCKGVSMEDSIFQVQEINLSPNRESQHKRSPDTTILSVLHTCDFT